MVKMTFTLAGTLVLTLGLAPAQADGIGALIQLSQLKAQEATTTGPSSIAFEVHTVRVITRNDAIGTRDFSIDSAPAATLQTRK